jgi:hypothetical protein
MARYVKGRLEPEGVKHRDNIVEMEICSVIVGKDNGASFPVPNSTSILSKRKRCRYGKDKKN